MWHTLRFTNRGRTPALLLNIEFEFLVLKEGVQDLPKPGETGKVGIHLTSIERFEHYLTGGTSIDHRSTVDVNYYIGKDHKEIMNLARTAIFQWRIQYRHFFSNDEIEERGLYYFSPSKMALVKTRERNEDQEEGANPQIWA